MEFCDKFSDNKDGSKKTAASTAAPLASGQQPSASGGTGQKLATGEPGTCQSLQELAITEPVPSIVKSGPMQQRQQQQQLQTSQQQAGGPNRKGQQQRNVPKQPPQQEGQRKSENDWPPAEERERTRGHSSQHHSHGQSSMSIEQLPRSVPQAESSQSIPSSSSSSATSVAIPKTSKTGKSIVEKSNATPKNLRALSIPTKVPGTRGKPLGLIETNYLELDISKLVEIVYKYDVEINIRRGPKKLNMAAFLKFRNEFFPNERGISYDWRKIALTNRQLAINGELVGDVQITHPGSGKTLDCNVTIKPANDGALVPIKCALSK